MVKCPQCSGRSSYDEIASENVCLICGYQWVQRGESVWVLVPPEVAKRLISQGLVEHGAALKNLREMNRWMAPGYAMDTDKAAQRLGVGQQRVRDLVRAGRLQAIPVLGRLLIRCKDIERERNAKRPPGRPKLKRAEALQPDPSRQTKAKETHEMANELLSKGDVAQEMAQRLQLSDSKARELLGAILDVVEDGLKHGAEVKTDIGTFKVVERAARASRNPKTGEILHVPAKRSVKLNYSKAVKDAVSAV